MAIARVADYEVVRSLGEGSHGECFLAIPPPRLELDQEFAVVKVLGRGADEDAFRRVVDQLRFVASVRSPHLVALFDVGFQSGAVYYAMEYCDGGSLASPAGPLERSEVVDALAHAARGAHALHDAGTPHRDIKPANILASSSTRTWRLSDPGLAPVLSPGQTTTGGGRTGGVEYIEPGVLRGERAGRASDVWSLGATIHRALSGASIYEGVAWDDVAAALRHMLTTPPSVSGALAPKEADLVRRCLAPERASRPPTALEIAEQLEQLAAAA